MVFWHFIENLSNRFLLYIVNKFLKTYTYGITKLCLTKSLTLITIYYFIHNILTINKGLLVPQCQLISLKIV
jgi:hypothetical protein